VVVDYDETIVQFISVAPSPAVTGIAGFIGCPFADNPDLGGGNLGVRLECDIAVGGGGPTGTVTLGTITVGTIASQGSTPLIYVGTRLFAKDGTCLHDSGNAACPPAAQHEGGSVTIVPVDASALVKDARPDQPGIQDLANLWLCEGATCTENGEGMLVIEEWVFNANDPDGLGAYEFQLKFDHKIFDIEVEDASFLGSTGRAVNCGMTIVTENDIRFGCVSTGGSVPGPTGSGVLARIYVRPEADLKYRLTPGQENGVVRTILDENCELADVLGDPLADDKGNLLAGILPGGLVAACTDATMTVRILEADLNLDCDVSIIDDQMIAFRYGAFFGDLLFDPWFDLEPASKDFDVDIKDLQKVFGRNGSTCQAPVPDQPPSPPPP